MRPPKRALLRGTPKPQQTPQCGSSLAATEHPFGSECEHLKRRAKHFEMIHKQRNKSRLTTIIRSCVWCFCFYFVFFSYISKLNVNEASYDTSEDTSINHHQVTTTAVNLLSLSRQEILNSTLSTKPKDIRQSNKNERRTKVTDIGRSNDENKTKMGGGIGCQYGHQNLTIWCTSLQGINHEMEYYSRSRQFKSCQKSINWPHVAARPQHDC